MYHTIHSHSTSLLVLIYQNRISQDFKKASSSKYAKAQNMARL